MSDREINKGFRKSKLDDIMEVENEEDFSEHDIEKGPNSDEIINSEKTDGKTSISNNRLSTIIDKHEIDKDKESLENTESEYLVTNEIPKNMSVDDLNIDKSTTAELEQSETEYESVSNVETTDTEHTTTDNETEPDSDIEMKSSSERKKSTELRNKSMSSETGPIRKSINIEAIVSSDSTRSKSSSDNIKSKSDGTLSKLSIQSKPQTKTESPADKIISDIQSDIIVDDIISGIINNAVKCDEKHPKDIKIDYIEQESGKKSRKETKVIENIKIKIDDLTRRYSEHGTEFSYPVSRLWKKGKSKDVLLERIEKRAKRQKRGQEYMPCNPFIMTWVYGFNASVPILNLITTNKIKVGFACAHAVIIYNHKKDRIRVFHGHRNTIQSIYCDVLRRWIVSADKGEDNTITVWDIKKRIPLKTYFTPHPEGTRLVAFDLSTKYIITVSFGQQIITVWSWTEPTNIPEASIRLSSTLPPIKSISFNSDIFSDFLFTTEKCIICASYTENPKKLTVYVSKYKMTNINGILLESTYIPRTHLVYVSTSKGYITIWSDTAFHKSFRKTPVTNKKIPVKKIKLQNESICIIKCIQRKRRLVITGDVCGCIAFYDVTLRILYWCKLFIDGPIHSMSFGSLVMREKLKDKAAEIYQGEDSTLLQITNSPKRKQFGVKYEKKSLNDDDEDYSDNFYLQTLPSDATIFRKEFLAVNFLLSTTGNIYYIEYTTGESVRIFGGNSVPVTGIAAHPSKNYFYFGDFNGMLYLYDYFNKMLVLTKQVKSRNSKSKPNGIAITSIGICSAGVELAIGLEDGSLHFYDPVLMEDEGYTFYHSKDAIRKIVFDKNSNFLAHYDDGMCVSLYTIGKAKYFMGKYKSHNGPITDILFMYNYPLLISISEDQNIVQYFVPERSDEPLDFAKSKKIEQFAKPTALIEYPLEEQGRSVFLVANDAFKYKLFNKLTKECIKTVQGPCLSTPVNYMQMLPTKHFSNEEYYFMIFGTDSEIGIQMFPADGNPFKAHAVIGSPTKLTGMSMSGDGRFLFTISEEDTSILMWEVNEKSVIMSSYYGGEGLEPYYCMLEGGCDGPMIKAIKDFFYYSQIIHDGEYLTGNHIVNNTIHLCDLINLLNALGYFPSLNEIANIISEVKRFSKKKDMVVQLTFEEVVKIYLNHRPAKGESERELYDAFKTFANHVGDFPEKVFKIDFVAGLEQFGEGFTASELDTTLQTLLNIEEGTINPEHFDRMNQFDPNYYSILPETITYKYFIEEILGLNTSNLNIPTPPLSERTQLEDNGLMVFTDNID